MDDLDEQVQEQQNDEQQAEEVTGETLVDDQPAAEVEQQQAEDDGEVVITIGDEAPPAAEGEEEEIPPAQRAAWARMRKTERELKQKLREFEQAETARQAAAAPKAEDVGPEPDQEDFDYDAKAYAKAYVEWERRKETAEAKAAEARKEQEAAQAEWNTRLTSYQAAKASLKVEDFDGAEHVVREVMSQTQIGVMLNGADKPELLVYAIGRNPAKAKELAAIKDPVKFAFAVAKLETQLKVQPRKTPPAPEREVRGTAGGATAVDNTLARLEAEADRTGDRTKVAAYRREQRRNAA